MEKGKAHFKEVPISVDEYSEWCKSRRGFLMVTVLGKKVGFRVLESKLKSGRRKGPTKSLMYHLISTKFFLCQMRMAIMLCLKGHRWWRIITSRYNVGGHSLWPKLKCSLVFSFVGP